MILKVNQIVGSMTDSEMTSCACQALRQYWGLLEKGLVIHINSLVIWFSDMV